MVILICTLSREYRMVIKMNISNLFKYKKTIDFSKYNNADETFFSKCEHHITKFRFRIHQTDEFIVKDDFPILTSYFPRKGCYDITCKSEMEENCTHPHKNISTYKICVNNTDIVIIKMSLTILYWLIIISLMWLIVLGINTLI